MKSVRGFCSLDRSRLLLLWGIVILCVCMLNDVRSDEFAVEKCPPMDFVDVGALAREKGLSLEIDLAYAKEYNFIGRRLPYYDTTKICLLRRSVAESLVQAAATIEGLKVTAEQVYGGGVSQGGMDPSQPIKLRLKIFDCYRPQSTVDYFYDWSLNSLDDEMETEFYSAVGKENLFRDGYIARRSGHSRGGTIDVAIVGNPPDPRYPTSKFVIGGPQRPCHYPLPSRSSEATLDFGTNFDCFNVASHTNASHTTLPPIGIDPIPEMTTKVSFPPHVLYNRRLLVDVLFRYGFINYQMEWWHFSAPVPDVYYDFPVREEVVGSRLDGCEPVDISPDRKRPSVLLLDQTQPHEQVDEKAPLSLGSPEVIVSIAAVGSVVLVSIGAAIHRNSKNQIQPDQPTTLDTPLLEEKDQTA
eukprot:TRINITY_DN3236_c0_g1_i2.p1 TRINITY_DN3236_c0_g1~~TRINITY_DN3236_c0_g1_i2.p1  ORF type:complete len:413 (-),score=79.95 TRINITY_DN3236_c0_g1_i2:525-1763(-)